VNIVVSVCADSPAPLLSSDRSPVEASIEDFLSCRTSVEVPPADHIQADAQVVAGNGPTLEQKLDMELQYHKNGSYPYVSQPDSAHACQLAPATASQPYPEGTSNPLQRAISNPVGRHPEEQHCHHPPMLSSVRPASAELSKDAGFRPDSSLYESMAYSGSGKSRYKPVSSSTPSLVEQQQQQGSSLYDRQISCPMFPDPYATAPDLATGLRAPNKFWAPNKIGPLQDSGAEERNGALCQILDVLTHHS